MVKTQQKPIESKEAEQTVLGSLLIDPQKIAEVLEKIRAEDFYYSNHQLIFKAMTDLEESGAPIDYRSVCVALTESGKLVEAGGMDFLVKLSEEVGHAANLSHFVNIVHEKSTLRRLAEISSKIYHACHEGRKPDELIIKAQEKLAELSAGAGCKSGNLTAKVRDWIKISPGQFEVRQIYNDLAIIVPGDKKTVLMALGRAEKEDLIDKIPGKRGHYRIKETNVNKIDFLHADPSNWLDLKLPLEIDKYVRLFPSNIVIIAGEKGIGKTSFCLDMTRMNKTRFPVNYLSSEMGPEELRNRLERFELPIEEWTVVNFRARRDNFADLIEPDSINVIDYLEKYDQFWTIASDICGVFDKLNKGICFIAIQKDTGAESGRGGMFTREKCRLHLALSRKKDPIKGVVNEAKIDDVKVFAMPGYNPNGLVLKYKLIQGARFSLAETGISN